MQGRDIVSCRNCGSLELTVETICEHSCGHVAPVPAFYETCPKCERETGDENLDTVGEAYRCLHCGSRFSTDLAEVQDEPRPTIAFPDLPTREGQFDWLPSRFVPSSEYGSRLAQTVFVILLLVTGVAVATAVVPFLETGEFEAEDDTVEDGERTWNEYEAVVMFRNDDIQAWYMHDELRELDRLFLDRDIAVTHGVIATVDEETNITADEELCTYLADLAREYPDLYEPANHGLTHERQTDFYNGSEFGGVPFETQLEWLEESDAIIEECVDTEVNTLIPPMNTYDENTVTALDELGYTTVSGARWMTQSLYDENESFVEGGLVHVPMWNDASMLNWSADDPDYFELEELEATFDEALEENAAYVHMLHYFTFTEDEHFELLHEFVEYIDQHDVVYMTIGDFGSGIVEGEVERTDDGWRVLEPVDDDDDDQDAPGSVDRGVKNKGEM